MVDKILRSLELEELREVFLRAETDATFLKVTRDLCALYLGGIWKYVDSGEIQVRPQSGGLNNLIFVVGLPEHKTPIQDEPRQVILRIYNNFGTNFELPEVVVFAILAERQLGPSLQGVFPGGRFEEFIPSRILSIKEFRTRCVAKEIGRILAKVHSLDMPVSKRPGLMKTAEDMVSELRETLRWSKTYPMHTTFAKYDESLCPRVIDTDLLLGELQIVKKCLAQSGSPVVFSNNDLHEGNVLLRNGIQVTNEHFVQEKQGVDPLVLIDYEYACYYYRGVPITLMKKGFDLCHYCVECTLHNESDEWPYYVVEQDKWPSEENMRAYVTAYLDEAMKIWQERGGKKPNCISDLPIEREMAIQRLLKEIRQFAAFPHILWAIWSYRQAENVRDNNYDFFEYGFDRMALYYQWKPEMLKYLDFD